MLEQFTEPLRYEGLRGRDIVSAKDLSRGDLEAIFRAADTYRENPSIYRNLLRRKTIALIFVEPSTRTFHSFERASRILGCDVIGIRDPSMTSIAKGESLHDTIRMIESYGADLIVLRHPSKGAALYAAEISNVPVINGGDGGREHPTQAILDLYTIHRKRGSIDGLRIGFLGDLRFSRTVPSLSYALTLYSDIEIYYIAPPILQIRREVEIYLEERGVKYEKISEIESLAKILRNIDVLYVTRLQKERFPDPSEYERLRGVYTVTPEILRIARRDIGIMHPLPRVDELSPELDGTPNAWYFDQARWGIDVRVALLSLVLG
ncbi:MAG: aspartate carbamoyltransferase [Desulfurococcales archaeon]|nr:aspartate carbamoyltransferase [Desulfurococcales archaeon]